MATKWSYGCLNTYTIVRLKMSPKISICCPHCTFSIEVNCCACKFVITQEHLHSFESIFKLKFAHFPNSFLISIRCTSITLIDRLKLAVLRSARTTVPDLLGTMCGMSYVEILVPSKHLFLYLAFSSQCFFLVALLLRSVTETQSCIFEI